MFVMDLSDFAIEIEDGAIKNVGAPNKSGSAKLFGVEQTAARAFGDERVKCVFADVEGNEVQVALCPEAARSLRRSIESLEAESSVFEA